MAHISIDMDTLGQVERQATKAQALALFGVLMERTRQDRKWGTVEETPHTVTDWVSLITEELGEAAREANELTFSKGSVDEWRTEMIQVAALALAALEDSFLRQVTNSLDEYEHAVRHIETTGGYQE